MSERAAVDPSTRSQAHEETAADEAKTTGSARQQTAVATEPIVAEDPSTSLTVAETGALTESQLAVLLGSPEDEKAEIRGGVTSARVGKRYLAGNEKTLYAFYPRIKNIGGGYVGVGSDQAYLLIGWQRPQLAWLVDYDAEVVNIHEVYRLFFLAADTPQQFLALWDKPGREQGTAIIKAAHPGERGEHLRRLYLSGRGWIFRRLDGVARRFTRAKVPCYLTDEEHYTFIQALLKNQRVRPMVANLHDNEGIKGVAQTARTLGVPIRVLYLSNAEEYWKLYPQVYRDNVASLPFADDAIVLRTLLTWELNQDYRYNMQPATNYRLWLQQPFVRNVYDIVHAKPRANGEIINVFTTQGDPQHSPAARRAQLASEPS